MVEDRDTQDMVIRRTVKVLHTMLTFATSVDIQRYIINRQATDFREFEAEAAELPQTRSLDGKGILATRDEILVQRPSYEQGFFHPDVPLGSHELGAYIDGFPLDASAASYIFTLLEVFGDDVAEIIKPGGIDRNKAWHEDVKGFADLRDSVQVRKAREGFAKHFSRDADDVPEIAARRMVDLKRRRNDFAHEGRLSISFEAYLRDVLAVICHIAFLVTDIDRLSVYPWEDHHDRFEPQTRA